MRDRRLERIQAIVQRQKRMPAESDDDGFFLDRQNCRPRLLRPCALIANGRALSPFGDGLLIDAVSLGEGPQALLTMLYRSTHRLCRAGAPVENLAHSASLQPEEKIAPSNSGIKHLAAPQNRDGRQPAADRPAIAINTISRQGAGERSHAAIWRRRARNQKVMGAASRRICAAAFSERATPIDLDISLL